VEDRISGLEDKTDIKEETEEFKNIKIKSHKKICKNSMIPLKEQICKSWALKKEKMCKPKVYTIYSAKQ
jgi:galactokinase/mevalonate kinase-like predicted kinase